MIYTTSSWWYSVTSDKWSEYFPPLLPTILSMITGRRGSHGFECVRRAVGTYSIEDQFLRRYQECDVIITLLVHRFWLTSLSPSAAFWLLFPDVCFPMMCCGVSSTAYRRGVRDTNKVQSAGASVQQRRVTVWNLAFAGARARWRHYQSSKFNWFVQRLV